MTCAQATKPLISTMWAPDDVEWNRLVEVLPSRRLGLRDVLDVVSRSRDRDGVILLGSVPLASRYRDLVLALALKTSRRSARVVISDATWEVGSRSLERHVPSLARILPFLARRLVRSLDGPGVTFGVLSSEEVGTLREVWGIKEADVVFTRFCHTIYDGVGEWPTRDDGHLFAGGNSLRDYPLLFNALEALGGRPTKLATSWEPRRRRGWLECRTLTHADFMHDLASCRASVVPISPAVRSAGQQTYLNAMVLAKPVVITEAPGVRDYVDDGVTGLIVPRRVDALAEAIDYVMSEEHQAEVKAMGQRARDWVMNNATPTHYRDQLLHLALSSERTHD